MQMNARFRGYFPVVVDVETAGFNAQTDALLELAAVTLKIDNDQFVPDQRYQFNVEPFEGANLEADALAFNGIDVHNPLRGAQSETVVLKSLFKSLAEQQKLADCQRCIMVAHNAAFDMGFLQAAITRTGTKNRSPFHPFASFDTTTLAAFTYGQTVLAKAMQVAKIEFDQKQAHSALYDAEKTAELFCQMLNRYQQLGGWPLTTIAD